MNLAARSLLIVAMSPLLIASSGFGQLLETTTNFSSGPSQTNQFNTNNGYLRLGSSLDGQPTNAPSADQWQTTDPYNPITDLGSTSLVAWINNYSPLLSSSGNNSVYYGGYLADSGILPGITNPSLYHDFAQSGVFASPSLLQNVTFSIDFAIIGPSETLSGLYTNKDYFGFDLLNSAGTDSLAQFRLNPFTAVSTNALRVEWVQNGTNVVTNGSSYKGFEIFYNTLYRLTATVTNNSTFDLSIAGLQTQSAGGVGITNYAVVTNANIVTGGQLSTGLGISDFGRVSLDWELSSGNNLNPGANYMIMTAASVVSQAVPEPSTWVVGMMLLAGVGFVLVRRRKESASVS